MHRWLRALIGENEAETRSPDGSEGYPASIRGALEGDRVFQEFKAGGVVRGDEILLFVRRQEDPGKPAAVGIPADDQVLELCGHIEFAIETEALQLDANDRVAPEAFAKWWNGDEDHWPLSIYVEELLVNRGLVVRMESPADTTHAQPADWASTSREREKACWKEDHTAVQAKLKAIGWQDTDPFEEGSLLPGDVVWLFDWPDGWQGIRGLPEARQSVWVGIQEDFYPGSRRLDDDGLLSRAAFAEWYLDKFPNYQLPAPVRQGLIAHELLPLDEASAGTCEPLIAATVPEELGEARSQACRECLAAGAAQVAALEAELEEVRGALVQTKQESEAGQSDAPEQIINDMTSLAPLVAKMLEKYAADSKPKRATVIDWLKLQQNGDRKVGHQEAEGIWALFTPEAWRKTR